MDSRTEILKARGNALYAQSSFAPALALYSKAIEIDPTSSVFRSNASAALFELGAYERCLGLANKAQELEAAATEPKKALVDKLKLRSARALVQLKRFAEASKLLEGLGGAEAEQLGKVVRHLEAFPKATGEVTRSRVWQLPLYRPAIAPSLKEFYRVGQR